MREQKETYIGGEGRWEAGKRNEMRGREEDDSNIHNNGCMVMWSGAVVLLQAYKPMMIQTWVIFETQMIFDRRKKTFLYNDMYQEVLVLDETMLKFYSWESDSSDPSSRGPINPPLTTQDLLCSSGWINRGSLAIPSLTWHAHAWVANPTAVVSTIRQLSYPLYGLDCTVGVTTITVVYLLHDFWVQMVTLSAAADCPSSHHHPICLAFCHLVYILSYNRFAQKWNTIRTVRPQMPEFLCTCEHSMNRTILELSWATNTHTHTHKKFLHSVGQRTHTHTQETTLHSPVAHKRKKTYWQRNQQTGTRMDTHTHTHTHTHKNTHTHTQTHTHTHTHTHVHVRCKLPSHILDHSWFALDSAWCSKHRDKTKQIRMRAHTTQTHTKIVHIISLTNKHKHRHTYFCVSLSHTCEQTKKKNHTAHTHTHTSRKHQIMAAWAGLCHKKKRCYFPLKSPLENWLYQWRVWFFKRCSGAAFCQIWRDVCLISHEYRWFFFTGNCRWTSFSIKTSPCVVSEGVSASLESVRSRSGGKETEKNEKNG